MTDTGLRMRTLSRHARVELEIRRSRFVAHAGRVDGLDDTLTFHASVADPDATHNCWAWRVGDAYRFHDDGEPGGTAGRPILTAIDGRELDHAMVVVTRYFGGIKLGAGGLVRAYAAAAARALDEAGIVTEQPQVECAIEAGFEWTGQLYAAVDASGAEKIGESYAGDGVRVILRLPAGDLEALTDRIRDMTRGEATLRKLD